MATTFFARHASTLDIDRESYNYLLENDLVGIHFPWDASGDDSKDSRSINPADYSTTSAIKSLNALISLAKNGGYVCAVYAKSRGCKIGFVDPDTSINLTELRWGNKNGLAGRVAVLKTLKLTKVQNLTATESLNLLVARPRQGTFCRWPSVKSRVENLVELKESAPSFASLTPDLQETLCGEFLRLRWDELPKLPRIHSFLMPIGRTMKDVDIFGVSESGVKILSQVTYGTLKASQHKLKSLKEFQCTDENNELVLFCNHASYEEIEGVHIVPVEEVFSMFESTITGQNWVLAHTLRT